MAAKRKRGRPRKGGIREANGRISRSGRMPRQEDATRVVVEARMTQYGLTEEQARHEKAGSPLGRMWLRKAISEDEREAGERLVEWHSKAQAAIMSPDSLVRKTGGGSSGDEVSEEYIEWAVKAISRWSVAKGWLKDRMCYAPFSRVVIGEGKCDVLDEQNLQRGLRYVAVKLGLNASDTGA